MGRASGLAMTHGHRDFTVCSCSSLPVPLPGWVSPAKCSTTAEVSGVPVMRNARPKACRRIAAVRQRSSGCSQAPRPGRQPVVSTEMAMWPGPAGTATIRSSSTANSRFRQPMHIRTGVRGCAAGPSRWITAQSTVTTGQFRTSLWDYSRAAPPGEPGAVSAASASLRMSMRQPVRRAASRAFCPSLPIARDSW